VQLVAVHGTAVHCVVLRLVSLRDMSHTNLFNGPLSGTTRVGRYQKGKTKSGFYWSKRQWVAVASAGTYAKSAPLSRQITTPAPHHLVFYRSDAFPATQPTASKHWRHDMSHCGENNATWCAMPYPVWTYPYNLDSRIWNRVFSMNLSVFVCQQKFWNHNNTTCFDLFQWWVHIWNCELRTLNDRCI